MSRYHVGPRIPLQKLRSLYLVRSRIVAGPIAADTLGITQEIARYRMQRRPGAGEPWPARIGRSGRRLADVSDRLGGPGGYWSRASRIGGGRLCRLGRRLNGGA